MRIIHLIASALALACALAGPARAQTSPGLLTGQVPTAAQWNGFFSGKQDTITSANAASVRATLGLGGAATVTTGAGVATALAASLNATGGLVGYSGSFGTPAQIDLTNATNIPAAGLSTVGGVLTQSGYVPATGLGSAANHNIAQTNAALTALASTASPVTRLGVYVAGDAPPLLFTASGSACSLGSGAGDGGSQVPTSDGNCWIASFPASGADVRAWGAACNWSGTSGTSDSSAFGQAIAWSVASGGAILIPPAGQSGGCYSSSGLNFANATVSGGANIDPTNAPSGPRLICPATIAAPCATFGVSLATTGLGGNVSNLIVSYYGTPVAGDEAFYVQGFNTVLTDVLAVNAWDGYVFANGISSHLLRPFTWKIANNHVIINGFPEVTISMGRFGMNGLGDQINSNAFFGITGNNPNSLICTGCQMNLGGQAPKYVYDFYSITGQFDGIYQMSDSIIDMSLGAAVAVIHSDGTGTCFRCIWGNVQINAPSIPMFSMGAAPGIAQSDFHDSNFFISAFNLPSGVYVDGLRLSNLYISGTMQLPGSVGSIVGVNNVEVGGALTLSGVWTSLTINGLVSRASFTDTATGAIYATGLQPIGWTPALKFGGNNVGMVLSSTGTSTRNGDGSVTQSFGLTSTNLGTSTGIATITGSPYTCVTYGFGAQETSSIFNSGMVSVAGSPTAAMLQGTNIVNLYQQVPTGIASLTNGNFTTSSYISGSVKCTPQ